MARVDFAGTGKVWINGTLFSEAAKITSTVGGKINRQLTTGYTGENVEDPTLMEVKIEGAPIRRDSLLTRIDRYRETQEDVTLKVQVGSRVRVGRGKIGPLEEGTEPGKSTFSTSFMGDKQ